MLDGFKGYLCSSRGPPSQTTINNYYNYHVLYPANVGSNTTPTTTSYKPVVTQRPDTAAPVSHTPVSKSQFAKNTVSPAEATTTPSPHSFSDIWTLDTALQSPIAAATSPIERCKTNTGEG